MSIRQRHLRRSRGAYEDEAHLIRLGVFEGQGVKRRSREGEQGSPGAHEDGRGRGRGRLRGRQSAIEE